MKKVYSGEGVKTICAISVSIKFSKEIAYWSDKYYYENPKFWEFWDLVNRKYHKNNLWYVMYCNTSCIKEAEEGKLRGSVLRCLTMLSGSKKIDISPTMNVVLTHDPSEYATTHAGGLNDLAFLCKECAKFCGGTVEITYSRKQHYFVWEDDNPRTIVLGKGIQKYKVKEPLQKKEGEEVEIGYRPRQKQKKK